jgi:hypothetical protein
MRVVRRKMKGGLVVETVPQDLLRPQQNLLPLASSQPPQDLVALPPVEDVPAKADEAKRCE